MDKSNISDPYGSLLLYSLDKVNTDTATYELPTRVDLAKEVKTEYLPHTVVINRIGYSDKDLYNKIYQVIANIEDVKQITAQLDKSR